MLHEELYTDATLVVEGQDIPVHRAVLAANSPVFKQMFISNMREGMLSSAYVVVNPTTPLYSKQ